MKNYLIVALAIILLSSCAESITRGKQYAKLYEEKPVSIVVMPPINQTNAVEAKDFFYTTMYMPLCEKGYYVYSPYLTMEMFQTESAYDSEMFLENDINIFKKVLGADAAMFTIIKSWSRKTVTGKLTQTTYVASGKFEFTVGGKTQVVRIRKLLFGKKRFDVWM